MLVIAAASFSAVGGQGQERRDQGMKRWEHGVRDSSTVLLFMKRQTPVFFARKQQRPAEITLGNSHTFLLQSVELNGILLTDTLGDLGFIIWDSNTPTHALQGLLILLQSLSKLLQFRLYIDQSLDVQESFQLLIDDIDGAKLWTGVFRRQNLNLGRKS